MIGNGMKGYTLIELVVVMVIIGIIAGVGMPAILETVDAWSFASRFQDAGVGSCMAAAGRMSREMRRLQNDSAVTTATSSQFSFTDTDSAAITYNLSGNTLMRNSDGLADGVSALTFTYYDDAGNIIAAPLVNPDNTDIRRIVVDFSILAGTNTLNFQFQIRPQNIRRLNEKFK